MRLQPIKSGATNSAGREKNLVESGLLVIGKNRVIISYFLT